MAKLKKSPYRIFGTPQAPMIVLQTRHTETRDLIDPESLQAYRAKTKIKTPWFDLRKGTKLFLETSAAVYMLEAGTIEPLDEPPLIPWRDREAAEQGKFSVMD